MRMIFIFIDGFGLGEDDADKNPVLRAHTPGIDHIFQSCRVIPTDASLGVKGLPQSATGQTAIFTGVNAPMVLGRHLNGQPTITLKNIINENNLFAELIRRGLKVTNSNVYREEYLKMMNDPKDRRHRPSVTSVMTMAAGLEFRTVDDFKQGKGIYHDITGQVLRDSGYDAELITPQEAAQRLYSISREYDFTLYEHFMTDIIGHKSNMELAVRELELLDSFLLELEGCIDPQEDVVIITSDHGNIEDITVRTHTMNKVPTVIIGRVEESTAAGISSLTDIMPAVLEMFEQRGDRE